MNKARFRTPKPKRVKASNQTRCPSINMPTAAAVLSAQATQLRDSLVTAAALCGLTLLTYTDFSLFDHIYEAFDSVLVWGNRAPSAWHREQCPNILALENGLVCQPEGMFVDNAGWYCESDLCRQQHWQEPYTRQEFARLDWARRHYFGWPFFHGGDPDGPIMFAVQHNGDAPCRHHFDAPAGTAKMAHALQLLAQYAPDRKVLVRPHPACPKDWASVEPQCKQHFKTDWELDTSSNPYPMLRQCSGLVTVNSTLANEALALGIPVATLGQGAFDGANVMLECADDPSRLAGLLEHKPDHDAVLRYLCACLRHQIPYTATTDTITANPYFRQWAKRALHVNDDIHIDVCLVKYGTDPRFDQIAQTIQTLPFLHLHVWDNTEVNVWLVAARNALLRQSSHEFVLFMDYDLELGKIDWQAMAEKLRDTTTGVVAPISKGRSSCRCESDAWEEKAILPCNFLMLRRDLMEELHGFDDRYFVAFADWDMLRRVQLRGYRILQHDGSCLNHEDHGKPNAFKQAIWQVDEAYYLEKWGQPLDRGLL